MDRDEFLQRLIAGALFAAAAFVLIGLFAQLGRSAGPDPAAASLAQRH